MVRDDLASPPKSIQNMNELIDNEKVVAVVGPTNSGTALAWLHIPQQKQIPIFSHNCLSVRSASRTSTARLRVGGEQVRRHMDLGGDPGDQGVERFLDLGKRAAGMPKQRKLHGEAQPVGCAPPYQNEFPIRWGKREATRQSIPICGNTKKPP